MSGLHRHASLAELTAGMIAAPPHIRVSDVTLDSRQATAGSLFLACAGHNHHGLQFARQAVAAGARAVLFENESGARGPSELLAEQALGADVFVAPVPQLGRHAGAIADRFFGAPSKSLTIAGITGTNGKTTCAWLLANALQHCGRAGAFMGTLGFGIPPRLTPSEHTTSDAVTVQRQLALLRELGAESIGMEVSSHAIDQNRVAAVRFHTVAFTNLTRDHLDYHRSMDEYGAAKARLFDWPALANRVINIDDAFGARLAARQEESRLVVTTRSSAALTFGSARYVSAAFARPGAVGMRIGIESSWGETALSVPLIGAFNVDNVLTVLAVLLAWDIPLTQAAAALARCTAPVGRMQMFGGDGRHPLAIVDFAHSPDALAKALHAARAHCKGRLRVVFGCGGDRDSGKRPQMGKVAAELADEVFLTDDNPRTEDPAHIVADILRGMPAATAAVVEHDRALAIRLALGRSDAEDVVLVAGKGHEDYQINGAVRRAFRDQDVVSAALAEAGA